jgi:uncharacterized membrane protein
MKAVESRLGSGRILSTGRALLCLAFGAGAGLVTAKLWTWELAPIVGWCVAASSALAWVWLIGWHQDAEGTERLAEDEQRSRSTDLWVVLAAVTSLGVVVVALQRSGGKDAVAVATVLLSVLSVTLAWALVNTVFALKYARLYYLDEPDHHGFDFGMDFEPAYSDFAYMAFSVGMAYAAAETRPNHPATRKVMLGHALLSYLFGTGVIAVAVSLVTNLGS